MMRVQHHAYCGMSDVPACFESRGEGRDYAAERLRRYRRRYSVTTLERGKQWEILEPADVQMVPDDCGTLTLEHVTYECRECGCACESQSDALHCCAGDCGGEQA